MCLIDRVKLYEYHTIFRALFWIALLFSYVAAIVPQDSAPSLGPLSDKIHHIIAFVVLGLLLRLGYKIRYWTAFLLLVVYGSFIEFSQLFTLNRSAEITDILADSIGIFIGLTFYKYFKKVFS